MATDDKLKISLSNPPTLLLLGNGINRAYDCISWDDLINLIKVKDLTNEEFAAMKKLPYPLQSVVLTGDTVADSMKEISQALTDTAISSEETEFLKSFAKLHFDAILTTNYTYELEKSTIENFDCKVGRVCKHREKAKDDACTYETKQ